MTEMVLPQFGMGMADGTIIVWHKSVGDTVILGEPLCDVEAAKTTVEVGASCSGVLQQILVPVGANVPVNTVIAIIGDEAVAHIESASTPPVPASKTAPSEPVSTASNMPTFAELPTRPLTKQPADGSQQVEPRARRAARLHGIELAQIEGTGPGGRIVEEDVIRSSTTPKPTAPVSVAIGKTSIGVIHQLRMHCDALPLVHLLEELGGIYDQSVPVEVALVKAAAIALVQSGIEGQSVGLRLDNGSVQTGEDAATHSLSAIASRMRTTGGVNLPAPAVVVELSSEHWLDEMVSIDPDVPANLSFGHVPSYSNDDGIDWQVILTIQNHAMSAAQAKLFLKEVRDLLINPLMILT